MASFKGDSYYEAHIDDNDSTYRELSDEEHAEPSCNSLELHKYGVWFRVNEDAIVDFYNTFKRDGTQIFGKAFFQLGTIHQFSKLLFKNTIVGGQI